MAKGEGGQKSPKFNDIFYEWPQSIIDPLETADDAK